MTWSSVHTSMRHFSLTLAPCSEAQFSRVVLQFIFSSELLTHHPGGTPPAVLHKWGCTEALQRKERVLTSNILQWSSQCIHTTCPFSPLAQSFRSGPFNLEIRNGGGLGWIPLGNDDVTVTWELSCTTPWTQCFKAVLQLFTKGVLSRRSKCTEVTHWEKLLVSNHSASV